MISVVVYPSSVFQILIFGEILEVNGWHTHIKVKKKDKKYSYKCPSRQIYLKCHC